MSRSGVLYDGARAAEGLLEDLFSVRIMKALDPLNAGDFVTICMRLSSSLRSAVAGTEGDALRAAIEELDVDWPNITEAGRDEVIRAAREQVAAIASDAAPLIEPVLDTAAGRIMGTTRRRVVDKFGLDIPVKLSNEFTKTGDLLRASTLGYVKDQYGQRSDVFDSAAREIVASGLDRGLGRDDISGTLAERLADQQIMRSRAYCDVLATSFANRARTATQLHSFAEASIERYMFDAILDQVTSDICRLLHGRVFSVKKAGLRMQRSLEASDPEASNLILPWVQTGTDRDGKDILYFNRGERRNVVAHVEESAVGESDKIGQYKEKMNDKQLEAAGVTVPPLHGSCRSNIVPAD